jgi:hypothetical protein
MARARFEEVGIDARSGKELRVEVADDGLAELDAGGPGRERLVHRELDRVGRDERMLRRAGALDAIDPVGTVIGTFTPINVA